MAIVTGNADQEGNFYRDIFGMKRSALQRAGGAVVVGDGYVGLNLNPRAPGRQAGFDHFGFEVQDTELVFSRLKGKYAKCEVLRRPSNRPFAGISMHDPNGNVFDLSQLNM
jgi:catechol 2,3-dioxygenase-like lactoylglutathione lyase family enzyme